MEFTRVKIPLWKPTQETPEDSVKDTTDYNQSTVFDHKAELRTLSNPKIEHQTSESLAEEDDIQEKQDEEELDLCKKSDRNPSRKKKLRPAVNVEDGSDEAISSSSRFPVQRYAIFDDEILHPYPLTSALNKDSHRISIKSEYLITKQVEKLLRSKTVPSGVTFSENKSEEIWDDGNLEEIPTVSNEAVDDSVKVGNVVLGAEDTIEEDEFELQEDLLEMSKDSTMRADTVAETLKSIFSEYLDGSGSNFSSLQASLADVEECDQVEATVDESLELEEELVNSSHVSRSAILDRKLEDYNSITTRSLENIESRSKRKKTYDTNDFLESFKTPLEPKDSAFNRVISLYEGRQRGLAQITSVSNEKEEGFLLEVSKLEPPVPQRSFPANSRNLTKSSASRSIGSSQPVRFKSSSPSQSDQPVTSPKKSAVQEEDFSILIQKAIQKCFEKPKVADLLPESIQIEFRGKKCQVESLCNPMFSKIRKCFNVSDQSLCDSVENLRGGLSGGRSGSFFFCTADKRFVIKSMSNEELDFLQDSLIVDYTNYVTRHVNTLIPKFYGMIKVHSGSVALKILIMNNVFFSEMEPNEIYDLKGSKLNRIATPKERLKKEKAVLKDVDFLNSKRKLWLKNESMLLLCLQLKDDCDFLSSKGVMDYSFLVGVHAIDIEQDTILTNSASELGTSSDSIPDSTKHEKNHPLVSVFQNEYGGMIARTSAGERLNEIYFLGIIDILQQYTWKKQIETNLKSMMHQKNDISSMEVNQYRDRFIAFVIDKVLYNEAITKGKSIRSAVEERTKPDFSQFVPKL